MTHSRIVLDFFDTHERERLSHKRDELQQMFIQDINCPQQEAFVAKRLEPLGFASLMKTRLRAGHPLAVYAATLKQSDGIDPEELVAGWRERGRE